MAESPTYLIHPFPDLPKQAKLHGWKKWTNALFGWPKPPMIAVCVADKFYVHPQNVARLREILSNNNIKHEVAKAVLSEVRDGQET